MIIKLTMTQGGGAVMVNSDQLTHIVQDRGSGSLINTTDGGFHVKESFTQIAALLKPTEPKPQPEKNKE